MSWLLVPASVLAAGQSSPRPLRALQEQLLLRPRANSFYSQDVLNPDVVRRGNLYYLFFSGNRAPTAGGDWRTGVAVSRNPNRGFRVLPQMQQPFLNGGTRVFGNSFVQVATPTDFGQPRIYKSRNLRDWQAGSQMPAGAPGSWNAFQSDPYYARSGRVFFAARPGASGADIGSRPYFGNGRWGNARVSLQRGAPGSWDSQDLGEPATFKVGEQNFMLYSGLGVNNGSRQIGLARWTDQGWRRVGKKPLIAAGGAAWYSRNAIDPTPLVVGDRLNVYFGGGVKPSLGGNMSGTIGVRSYKLADFLRWSLQNTLK